MPDREDNIYKAKLAEQTGRYDVMAKAMVKVVYLDHNLTHEERNLLSVAFKNMIGPKRASWRTIHNIEQHEQNKGAKDKLEMIRLHRFEIETEIQEICQNIIHVLDVHLIPTASTDESKVFYYKMKGDYHRYLSEFATGEKKKEVAKNSLDAYKVASDIANAELPATDSIRLLLAMNFSVLLFEILDDPNSACDLAKTAFDDAMAELDTLKGDNYKNCTVILQMLRDNLTLWTSDMEEDGEGVEQKEATQEADESE